MPFYLEMGNREQPKVSLEVVDDRRFRLMTAFVYEDPFDMDARQTNGMGLNEDEGPPPWLWQVPGKGEVTDLASVPPLLWGWFAPYGRQLLPALLHDHYCAQAEQLLQSAPAADRRPVRMVAGRHRAHADLLFRRSLREQKVGFARRWLMWAAVSLQGMWKFRRSSSVVTFLLALVVSWVVWSVSWRAGGPLWLGVLATGPAALGWLIRITGAEPVAGRHQGNWWALQRVVTVAILGGYFLPLAFGLFVTNWVAGALLEPSSVWLLLWAAARKLHLPVRQPPREPGPGPLLVKRV